MVNLMTTAGTDMVHLEGGGIVLVLFLLDFADVLFSQWELFRRQEGGVQPPAIGFRFPLFDGVSNSPIERLPLWFMASERAADSSGKEGQAETGL